MEIGRPEPCLLIVVQLTIVPRSENFRSFVNILAELRISCGKTQSILAVVPAVFVPVAYNDLPNVVVGGVSIPLASSIDRNRVLLCSLYASSVPQSGFGVLLACGEAVSGPSYISLPHDCLWF